MPTDVVVFPNMQVLWDFEVFDGGGADKCVMHHAALASHLLNQQFADAFAVKLRHGVVDVEEVFFSWHRCSPYSANLVVYEFQAFWNQPLLSITSESTWMCHWVLTASMPLCRAVARVPCVSSITSTFG